LERIADAAEIVAMQRSQLAVLLALAFLTVWTAWGLGWGPEPDGQEDRTEAVAASDDKANAKAPEDRKEAVTASDDKCDEEVDDYLDAVEDCLDEAKTLDAAKDCSDAEP
jgi:hypothetical protein